MEVRTRTLESNKEYVITCDIPTKLHPSATETDVKEAASEEIAKIKALFAEYFPDKIWRMSLLSECKVTLLRTGKVCHELQFELHCQNSKINAFVYSLKNL